MTLPAPPLFLALAGFLSLSLGVIVGLLQRAVIAYLRARGVTWVDAMVWFWLVAGFIITLLVAYPVMFDRCEPSVTCRLVP